MVLVVVLVLVPGSSGMVLDCCVGGFRWSEMVVKT